MGTVADIHEFLGKRGRDSDTVNEPIKPANLARALKVSGFVLAAAGAVIWANGAVNSSHPYGEAPAAVVTFGPDASKGQVGVALDPVIRAQAEKAEAAAEAAHPGVDVPDVSERTLSNMRAEVQFDNPGVFSAEGRTGEGSVATIPQMTVTQNGVYQIPNQQ